MRLITFLILLGIFILYRHKFYEEWMHLKKKPRQWCHEKWKNWGEPLLIAAVLAILIRSFVLGPYKIPTGSMRPTFLEGDRIFVDKVSYRFREPERGDVIVFKYPNDEKKDFVKRLVGLPGDTLQIRDGFLYVNGEKMDQPPFSEHYYYNVAEGKFGKTDQLTVIPEDRYFVLGDNSAHSSDSRHWGFVPEENLVGRAFLIWWPPNRVKSVR